MSLEVPDLATANAFVSGSYDKYSSCVASYDIITTTTGAVSAQAGVATSYFVQIASSLPAAIFGTLTMIAGVVLMFYGFKLVRPVNFAAGAYLGWTTSLILLTVFAPNLASCPAILSLGTVSGLLVGVLCAMKRASVMAVLGVVAGEMLGDVFFKTFLASVAPEYVAFGCIGFFAVLLAVLSAYAGDFAFMAFCSFFGAYLAVSNFVKHVLVPYSSGGASYLPFLTFRPELTQMLVSGQTIIGSPYLYGPVLVIALLTAVGTSWQVTMLAKSKKAEDMQGLIGK